MIIWDKLNLTNNSGSVILTPGLTYLDINKGLSVGGPIKHREAQGQLTFESLTHFSSGVRFHSPIECGKLTATDDISCTNITSSTGTITARDASFANITASSSASLTNPEIKVSLIQAQPYSLFSFSGAGAGAITLTGVGNLPTMTISGLDVTIPNNRLTTNDLTIRNSVNLQAVIKYSNIPSTSPYNWQYIDKTPDVTDAQLNLNESNIRNRLVNAGENFSVYLLNICDKIYDLYIYLDTYMAGEDPDRWWVLKLNNTLKTIYNNSTIIEKQAWERDKCSIEDNSETLRGYQSNWKVDFIEVDNNIYLGFGLDSHTRYQYVKIRGMARVRFFKR